MNMFFKNVMVVIILNILGTLGDRQASQESDVNFKGGLDIKDTIEKFLEDLHSQIPEVFGLGGKNFTISNNEYITGTVNMSNITCTGLKQFNATVIYRRFIPLPKAFTFSLENLAINLEYDLDITLFNSKYLSFFGAGTTNITLKNLFLDGNVSVSFIPVNVSANVFINLDNVLVDITGLLGDEIFSRDFGRILGDSIMDIFDENKSALSKMLTDGINFAIQYILSHRQLGGEQNNDIVEGAATDSFLSFEELLLFLKLY